ncbi:MAG: insulinase family protein [Phycisphaerae bacterium]|nr:insulinase family protein [Phycisphaerae bacterium]
MEFKRTQLDNGLTIITEVNPSAASMAAGFFVRTGSRDETPEVSGVSHFLEHLVFKGTDRRTAFDVNREFDEMGANYNAATSEENTVYYAAVLPEFQTQVLDLLCDLMRPSLRKEDFDLEKGVILEEIALYEDLPSFRVYDKLMSEHFAGHPLGNNILGTTESIKGLRAEDMRACFDRQYSPNNIVVVGTGNLDFDQFVHGVARGCASWQPCRTERQTPDAPGSGTENVIHDPKVSREHIGLISAAPSAQDDARYAAELLAGIVGDATGSRLFYALVDPAVADEATMAYRPLDGAGAFYTFISAEPEQARRAAQIARTEFDRFVKDGPGESEMRAAKNKIASAATIKGELPMGRLAAVGGDWVYRKQYMSLTEQIDMLFAVTRNDVADLARQYNLTATTTLALGPLKDL